MKRIDLYEDLRANSYPGRGIVIGKSADGTRAVTAYFIMGRSENSRNRIFAADGLGLKTQAYDESKVTDPSLIIYSPVRLIDSYTIVTNGDQTDTIYEGIDEGLTFTQSLQTREFEPDVPNYTPRISGILHVEDRSFDYMLSILKSNEGDPGECLRYTYSYPNPSAAEGRFIHTYQSDGNPLPSFEGEPKRVVIDTDDIDEFTQKIWEALNEDNKVSLFTRFIDIADGTHETRIVNKHK